VSDGERRPVRVAHEVFDRLDAILGPERGPEGRPSANDFLTFDLVEILEVFATQFDAPLGSSTNAATTGSSSATELLCTPSRSSVN
jgi:hypothetical protein